MAGSLDEIRDWLRLAKQAVAASKLLLDGGYSREAVSRSYYAMFYAAKAATVSRGVRARKHSTVVSSFGQLFAKTGIVPGELHRNLTRAFAERQSADYEPTWQVNRTDAEVRLAQAEQFVAEIEAVLSETSG